MKFVIFPNQNKDVGLELTKKTALYITSLGGSVCMDSTLCEALGQQVGKSVSFCTLDECLDGADYAVVIGGDGSILQAARIVYGKNIPIVGINLGTVGYMAELERDELELLGQIVQGGRVDVEERMMLSVHVERDGRSVYSANALNDVVVSKGVISRMIDVSVEMKNGKVADYRCDGIIASTPTGSTAYLMSAGGPIIDPSIECISVIPVCPYLCINDSPIIFSKDSEIRIGFESSRGNKAYLNADGEGGFELNYSDTVVISRAEHSTKLVRIKKTDFYKLLHSKLSGN